MTTDSNFQNRSYQQSHDLLHRNTRHTNESTGARDMVKRDRFELLSAYLDGEVTAAERRQVEEWLAKDASVQRLYARLLKLRQGLRSIPVPKSEQPLEETVEQVMARLRRRSRLAWVCGGTAIAATIIGTVSSILPGGQLTPQLAYRQSVERIQPQPEPVAAAPLMVAINNPIIPIPKAAEASPVKPINQQKQLHLPDIENEYH